MRCPLLIYNNYVHGNSLTYQFLRILPECFRSIPAGAARCT